MRTAPPSLILEVVSCLVLDRIRSGVKDEGEWGDLSSVALLPVFESLEQC